MRWGDEGKDYFWITDMHPTMIMHPYLPELDGQDLTSYQDKAGNHLFVAMVDEVEKNGSGFVEYYWQYKDDPSRIVPKLSYVAGVRSLAVGDRHRHLRRRRQRRHRSVQRNLIYISVAIFVAVALLLLYSGRQSLKIERRRAAAEQELKESHEKYRFLVEASTEGLLMTIGGKATYANKPLADMLGYSAGRVPATWTQPAVHRAEGTDKDWPSRGSLAGVAEGVPHRLRSPPQRQGRPAASRRCVTATPIWLAGSQGFILLVRASPVRRPCEAALEDTRKQFKTMSDALTLGVFRSTWGSKATLLEVNPAMRTILVSRWPPT